MLQWNFAWWLFESFSIEPRSFSGFHSSAMGNEIILLFNSTFWAFFRPIAITFAYSRYWDVTYELPYLTTENLERRNLQLQPVIGHDKASIVRGVNPTEQIICCTVGSWTSFSFSHVIAPDWWERSNYGRAHTRARRGELFVFVALLGRPVNN